MLLICFFLFEVDVRHIQQYEHNGQCADETGEHVQGNQGAQLTVWREYGEEQYHESGDYHDRIVNDGFPGMRHGFLSGHKFVVRIGGIVPVLLQEMHRVVNSYPNSNA